MAWRRFEGSLRCHAVRELVVDADPAERTPTQTHDSMRESRVIGAEPKHDDREKANAVQALYANDGRGAIEKTKRPPRRLWKRRSVEKSKSRLSTSLGNPAKTAGFPLFTQ